jgi:hypothetical protein
MATPDAADIVSESGLLQGTRESIDDPVGEISFFGYRVPVVKGGLGSLAGAGLVYAGAKGMKTGRLPQAVNRLSRKVSGKDLMAPVEFQAELPLTYGGPRQAIDDDLWPQANITNKELYDLRKRSNAQRYEPDQSYSRAN